MGCADVSTAIVSIAAAAYYSLVCPNLNDGNKAAVLYRSLKPDCNLKSAEAASLAPKLLEMTLKLHHLPLVMTGLSLQATDQGYAFFYTFQDSPYQRAIFYVSILHLENRTVLENLLQFIVIVSIGDKGKLLEVLHSVKLTLLFAQTSSSRTKNAENFKTPKLTHGVGNAV